MMRHLLGTIALLGAIICLLAGPAGAASITVTPGSIPVSGTVVVSGDVVANGSSVAPSGARSRFCLVRSSVFRSSLDKVR
jgi:type 1 fimbria pilin